jgi:hypothetical protein
LAKVSNSEMSIFLQGQENQGIARRRTEVCHTSDPTEGTRDCGKGPFMDENKVTYTQEGSSFQLPARAAQSGRGKGPGKEDRSPITYSSL